MRYYEENKRKGKIEVNFYNWNSVLKKVKDSCLLEYYWVLELK